MSRDHSEKKPSRATFHYGRRRGLSEHGSDLREKFRRGYSGGSTIWVARSPSYVETHETALAAIIG